MTDKILLKFAGSLYNNNERNVDIGIASPLLMT